MAFCMDDVVDATNARNASGQDPFIAGRCAGRYTIPLASACGFPKPKLAPGD